MSAINATIGETSAAGRPGLLREYELRNMATGRPTVVSLFSGPTSGGPTSGGPVEGAGYEVIEEWAGPAAGQAAGVANLMVFDGPISPVGRAAHDRAWTGRLRPVFAQLPGTVGTVGLWDAERRSMAVLVLTTSLDAMEALGKAVFSTQLLPDEDPALLPGPDRSDIHLVTNVHIGAAS